MNPLEAQAVTLKQVIQSNIDAKFFADYGVVTATTGTPVTAVDVTHFAPAYYDDGGNPIPCKSKAVEVLYTATAGVSIEVPIAVGDIVLLVGSHNYVNQLSRVANAPVKPAEDIAYTKETLKAIPVGVLNASAGVYLRFKGGKVQLKNAAASLYTALDNFETAVQTFSSTASQSALTAGAATSASLATALNLLLASMNASVTAAKSSLAQILEA